MKKAERVALLCAAALLGVVCLAGRATGQELSAEAKDKAAAEARAKRNALAFDGQVIVSEPNALKRSFAERYGATAIDPTAVDLREAVDELTSGRRVEYAIDAAGAGSVFTQLPSVLRKQGTVLLYGHGHAGVDLSVLNNVQFLEPTLISPVGASGGFEPDGRPTTYRRALGLLETGRVEVDAFITHRYHSLDDVPGAFAGAHKAPDYVKGVVEL